MLKQLLVAALMTALFAQGIVHAEEPPPVEMTTVANNAALVGHIDALTVGEDVVVATDEGIVVGELVDRDADDVIVSRPLIEGGIERIVIPVSRIQGLKYRQAAPGTPSKGNSISTGFIVVVAVIGVVLLLLARALPGP
jgi:hypothetical protein